MSRRDAAAVFPRQGGDTGRASSSGVRILAFDDETGMTGRRGAVRRKTWKGAALLLALLVVSACGMEPYQPRNNREEGPKSGLLTGEQGEFVIFRLRSKPKGGEGSKGGDEESETQDSQ